MLLHHIFNVGLGDLTSLSDFYLIVIINLAVSLFMIVHGRADLVLSLEHLHLCVITPDHCLDARLLLDGSEYTLMEIVNIKSVFAQEVSDIVLECLFVLAFFPLFHRLNTRHSKGPHG